MMGMIYFIVFLSRMILMTKGQDGRERKRNSASDRLPIK